MARLVGHGAAPRDLGVGAGWLDAIAEVVAWNTPALAATVGLIWIGTSLLFLTSRSLLAAIVFNNIMAVTGFATRGLAPPSSAAIGWLLGGLALAVFAVVFAATRARLNR